MNVSNILVATDLSQEAMSCIPDVVALARANDARITLLHVVDSHEAMPHGSPLAPPVTAPTKESAVESARAQLEERRKAYGSDVPIEVALVVGGDPAERITEYAASNGTDMIAMTTHGRTGVRRIALGSVAEAVIRQARVPVLVLPLARN